MALHLVRRHPRQRPQPDPRESCAAPLAAQPALDGAHGRGLALDDGQHLGIQIPAMAEARVLDRRQHGWIAQLCRRIDEAACFRLVVGGLDSAVALLVSSLQRLQPPVAEAAGVVSEEGNR